MKKVTEHAQGQWPRILSALAGLSPDQLTDKHQPCPLCGGKDRYRFDDKDGNGSWFCNKCGGKNESGGAGNGMELLMRRKSWDYQTAATEVERFLGVSIEKPKSQAKPKPPISRAELHWWYSENFVVARFPEKKYRPFVFDGTRWTAGVPNPPRPLLNLKEIKACTRTVIVVEGEKACDAATKLFPGMVATTWSSGCKAHGKTSFNALVGRKVILWPDADEPGRDAMEQIAKKLLNLGSHIDKIRIAKPPEGVPKGWDLADAEWSTEEATAYLKANLEVPSFSQEELALPEPSPEPELERIEPGSYFTCLGFDADCYFYQPHGTGQVIKLSRSAHTSTNLVCLAPLEFWEIYSPGAKGGVDWIKAASMLFEDAAKCGVYTPLRIRGRGAWWDNNRTVLHLGDRIIADGNTLPILKPFESSYIYQRLSQLDGFGKYQPLSDQEAMEALDLACRFLWEMPASGLLLAGWTVLAPVCGALDWRPHIWLTAAAGSGKSAILDRYVTPLLSDMALTVAGNTTEAGIRQSLRSDALPIVFDEAESNEKVDQIRMQNVLALARVASSESKATTVKGSAHGEATRYHIRSMFMMSSIATHLKQGADQTRFAQLTLKSPNEIAKEERAKHWDGLDRDLDRVITKEYSKSLIHRTITLIPMIRESVKVFVRVAADHFGSQRLGDQYGTLLAGAWSLQSSQVATEEDAKSMILSNDWTVYSQATEISDERKCLDHMLQHQIRVEADGKTVSRTIGELIEIAALIKSDFDISPTAAQSVLGRHGFKVPDKERVVLISNTAKAIKAILQDTSWGNSWHTMLKRLPGASAAGPTRFGGVGGQSRAVAVRFDEL